MDNYHITKHGKQWSLTKEGNKRASLATDTKAELLKSTAGFLAGKGGSVKIHKETGEIQEERTYPRANDPRKSKG